mgnify:CR=1 FL=1
MSKIFVQENFFDDETYKIIVDQMLKQEYIPPEQYAIDEKKSCYWHYHELPEVCEVKTEIKRLVKKYFFYEIEKFTLPSIYTMVGATDHPKPHTDVHIKGCVPKYQLIIYMFGPESINNGTGFYERDEETGHGEISLHVGFKANRAIFFSANTIHSPLQWAGNGSFRYSINNFFK